MTTEHVSESRDRGWFSLGAKKLAKAALAGALAAFGLASTAQAQDVETPSSGGATKTGGGTTVVPPWGYPQPGSKPQGSHLPSGSRMNNGRGDSFDFGGRGGGGKTLKGRKGAFGSFGGRGRGSYYNRRVPAFHVVRRGDTLWDICDSYHHNPWMWPRVWSYNPQVQNPHWIYPGDHINLRNDGGDSTGNGLTGLQRRVGPQTIFLRNYGYIDEKHEKAWGKISGSPKERMILAEGDPLYVEFVDNDHAPTVGQNLAIYRPVRGAPGKAKGDVVEILGTFKVDSYNEKKKLARGTIVESLDVIERGAKVGPVGRRFSVVPPKRNDEEIHSRVLVSVHPHVFHARNQMVFIDKGKEDGLEVGNRLFVVRRGDQWRKTLPGSGDLSDMSVRHTTEKEFETVTVRGTTRDKDYPAEVVGELRVLRIREHTAACLVTRSKVELKNGDVAITRKGY